MFIRLLCPPAKAVLRNRQPDRLRGLEINEELEVRGLLDGKIPWLCALENLVDVGGGAMRNCCVMFTCNSHPRRSTPSWFPNIVGRRCCAASSAIRRACFRKSPSDNTISPPARSCFIETSAARSRPRCSRQPNDTFTSSVFSAAWVLSRSCRELGCCDSRARDAREPANRNWSSSRYCYQIEVDGR